MSKCERCNKVAQGFMLYQFGYKEICFDCYRELKDKQDLKTEEELQDLETLCCTFLNIRRVHQKNYLISYGE